MPSLGIGFIGRGRIAAATEKAPVEISELAQKRSPARSAAV